MLYKYDEYELESLKKYLNDNTIELFINDIMNCSNSGVLRKIDGFDHFKLLYSDILNLFSLSCKYGANNEIRTALFTNKADPPIVRYQSYLNDPEDLHFMLNNFAMLSGKNNTDDILFFTDEDFISGEEIPFIDVYDLLKERKGLYILPPFIDVVSSFDNTSFQMLPLIAPSEDIEDSFYKISDEELYKYYLSIINNTDQYKSISNKIKNDLRNCLTQLHYKYMIGPKIEMVENWRRKL
ncbi:MAG: hypothetical protein IKO49_06870 [Bacilli bacterium]|nr:hypothetical protein [Bacilli bacterium]